ncbi:MAG TPA: TonB family protein [Candidatus Udaeobacter sp.]
MKKRRAPLAYLAMRVLAFFLIALLSIVDLAWSQGSATPSGQASATPSGPATGLPMVRPALIGEGPGALINRIDEQDLVRKGQKDALVMFLCAVKKDGEVDWSATYRGTPDSDFLKQELQRRISPAANLRFIPAVHDHQLVDAIYYGTVTFRLVNGKPRLRIFSNQEAGELEQEHDFIGPQPFFGDGSGFTGFHYPPMESGRVQVDGKVELKVKIDATGNLQEMNVLSEEPPLLGFGDAALKDFRDAKFIPAFRDGKPVECEVTLPVFYKAAGI